MDIGRGCSFKICRQYFSTGVSFRRLSLRVSLGHWVVSSVLGFPSKVTLVGYFHLCIFSEAFLALFSLVSGSVLLVFGFELYQPILFSRWLLLVIPSGSAFPWFPVSRIISYGDS